MTVEEVQKEAETLPIRERGALIASLIEGLGQPDYDVSDEEVAERGRELESGAVQEISHEELIAGLKNVPSA